MPYAPIIPLIMGAGPVPPQHWLTSEVTQGKVGGEGERRPGEREGEIDFTCFLSWLGVPSARGALSPSTSPINNNPHCPPCPPRHPSILEEKKNPHRLPSCSASLFFQTPIHVHLLFQHVSHYPRPSEKCSATSGSLFVFREKCCLHSFFLIYKKPP